MADVQIDSDSAFIPAVNFTEQVADPDTPAAGHWRLFFKAGGLYLIDDTGAVTGPLGTGGGSPVTVEEADANPSEEVTTLVFPNGTLTVTSPGVVEYTPEAPGGGGDFVRIAEVVVPAGGQASIEFASIPDTYRHLELHLLTRETGGSNEENQWLNFNDDTSALYNYHHDKMYSTAFGNVEAVNQTKGLAGITAAVSGVANRFAHIIIHIPYYAHTTRHKNWSYNGSSSQADSTSRNDAVIGGGLWASTAAITKITITPNDGNFVAGSIATLYGLA